MKLAPAATAACTCLWLTMGSASVALGADERVQHTGTFSSFAYNEEAGDMLGVEIRIVPTLKGLQGTFQLAEGYPQPLVLVQPHIDGNRVAFEFTDDRGNKGRFTGTIADDAIRGRLVYFTADGEPRPYIGFGDPDLVLPRKCGYWDCPGP